MNRHHTVKGVVMKHWTPQDVRDELPMVHVLFNGKTYEARVIGRLNDFATVWSYALDRSWEYSWKTIANALNDHKYLRA